MKKVMILNPAAGHGDAIKLKDTGHAGVEVYETIGVGDAERYVIERCATEPETQFIVCGGDGTVNEVVNGIMKAGAGDKAAFSVVPTGSGNDFIKISLEKGIKHLIDLIKYNGRYAVNMLNIGFDSRVVEATEKHKKKHNGATAYLLGVADAFFKKIDERFRIALIDKDGNLIEKEDDYILCAVANGQYCGGGFNFAPISSVQDGILDCLMIKKVSRARFLTIFGEFKKGNFIEEDGTIKKKFKGIIEYIKCRSLTVFNTTSVCADGEVEHTDTVNAEAVHNAVYYIA